MRGLPKGNGMGSLRATWDYDADESAGAGRGVANRCERGTRASFAVRSGKLPSPVLNGALQA